MRIRNGPSTSSIMETTNSLCSALVKALGVHERAVRYLHPPLIPMLQEKLIPYGQRLERVWEEAGEIDPGLNEAARLVLAAYQPFLDAADMRGIDAIYRSFRPVSQALEILYPLRRTYPVLYNLFLETPVRDHIDALDPEHASGERTGIVHHNEGGDPSGRGGFSLYVPESYDGRSPWPLVIALHGGHGHGRDFLWMWLREAKSRRFLLLAPTARLETWNIVQPGFDAGTIRQGMAYCDANWAVDHERVLLTGISDGASYALAWGLREAAPFSHLAPIAGVLPPMRLEHARGKRIFWVHGQHDWMFPVGNARQDCTRLEAAGADVTLRVVSDLSHSYPREWNDIILSWFDERLKLNPPDPP